MDVFLIIMKVMLQLCIATWNGMVGIFNFFIGKANAKAIEKNNRISRGVLENKSVPIDSIFTNGCERNSVVSGSELFVRNQMILNALLQATRHGRSVILFHESNSEIENLVAAQISDSVIIDRRSIFFDPFYNCSDSEIIKMVLSIAKKEYGIRDEARYAIQGMVAFLNAKKRKPSLSTLASCPYNDLYNKVDEMIYRGQINDSVGNDIKSYLSSGQAEYIKLKSFFEDLIDECGASSSKNAVVDLINAISAHKVILIDIGNSSNYRYIASLIFKLETALRMNLTYALVLDSITITQETESLKRFITSNHTHCSLTFTSNDLYSMLNCDEKLLYTVLGNSVENIIMQHGSAVSAEEWSKAIGFYEKTETTTTVSKGKTNGGFSLFPSYNDSKSLAYSVKREPIVKAEEILRMSNNEMYIYNRSINQLHHCFAVN